MPMVWGVVASPDRRAPGLPFGGVALPRTLASTLFASYLLVLFALTLLLFPQPGARPNLTPFASIAHDLQAGGRGLLVNFLGNLVAFLPMGFLVPVLAGGWASARRVTLFSLGLSLAIEVLQYLSARRVADVDDILLNSLGGLLGYLAFLGLRRWWPRPSAVPAT